MAGRRTALIHLASHLAAAVLADLLGIVPTTAVHWVRTAGGDWTTYAAQLIHDPPGHHPQRRRLRPQRCLTTAR